MILPSPFGGRWLEEPDEGRVFEIAYERVMRHACPSSVRFADSFPPRGSLFVAFAFPLWGKVAPQSRMRGEFALTAR